MRALIYAMVSLVVVTDVTVKRWIRKVHYSPMNDYPDIYHVVISQIFSGQTIPTFLIMESWKPRKKVKNILTKNDGIISPNWTGFFISYVGNTIAWFK